MDHRGRDLNRGVFIVGIALSDRRKAVNALAILLASYPVNRGTRRLFRRTR